jgi:predicted branched-subunit amino acid permease
MESQTALPVYRRVTIAGLAFLLVAHLLLIVVNAAETQTAFLIFDVVAIVLLVVGAGLIWKYGRWTLIVAVILALLAGEYEYTCEVPGHEEMKGTLVVSP